MELLHIFYTMRTYGLPDIYAYLQPLALKRIYHLARKFHG